MKNLCEGYDWCGLNLVTSTNRKWEFDLPEKWWVGKWCWESLSHSTWQLYFLNPFRCCVLFVPAYDTNQAPTALPVAPRRRKMHPRTTAMQEESLGNAGGILGNSGNIGISLFFFGKSQETLGHLRWHVEKFRALRRFGETNGCWVPLQKILEHRLISEPTLWESICPICGSVTSIYLSNSGRMDFPRIFSMDFPWFSMKFPTTSYKVYPLVIKHSYWKWPFIVDLPMKHGDFP